jgi:hypothetical protein
MRTAGAAALAEIQRRGRVASILRDELRRILAAGELSPETIEELRRAMMEVDRLEDQFRLPLHAPGGESRWAAASGRGAERPGRARPVP